MYMYKKVFLIQVCWCEFVHTIAVLCAVCTAAVIYQISHIVYMLGAVQCAV